MSKRLFCLQFRTSKDHHVFNGFVEQLHDELNDVYDEIHSEDQHNWMFFFRCDIPTFERIKEFAESELRYITYFEAFPLSHPNTYSMNHGDKRVILDCKYPE
jgi:hypothetical protein